MLLSELDDDRHESRKIEVFKDGRTGYACFQSSSGGTVLGERSIPPDEEIVSDPQFQIEPITLSEFEAEWRKVTT